MVQSLAEESSSERLRAMIGFSEKARYLDPSDINEGRWDYVYGSNLAEALDLVALQLDGDLGRVVIFSDLLPTAHTTDGGEAVFSSRTSRITMDTTLEAIYRYESNGATIEAVRFFDPGTKLMSEVEVIVEAIIESGGVASEAPVA